MSIRIKCFTVVILMLCFLTSCKPEQLGDAIDQAARNSPPAEKPILENVFKFKNPFPANSRGEYELLPADRLYTSVIMNSIQLTKVYVDNVEVKSGTSDYTMGDSGNYYLEVNNPEPGTNKSKCKLNIYLPKEKRGVLTPIQVKIIAQSLNPTYKGTNKEISEPLIIKMVPNGPKDAVGSLKSNRVTLTWRGTYPVKTQLSIERKDNGGNYQVIKSNLPVETSSYVDTLAPLRSGTYIYRIHANKTNYSQYSNEVQIIVPKLSGTYHTTLSQKTHDPDSREWGTFIGSVIGSLQTIQKDGEFVTVSVPDAKIRRVTSRNNHNAFNFHYRDKNGITRGPVRLDPNNNSTTSFNNMSLFGSWTAYIIGTYYNNTPHSTLIDIEWSE